MRKKIGIAMAALLATAALGAPGASAATEFGDNCAATASTEASPVTLFEIGAPGNPLPTTAPSAGVVTKWKVNVAFPAFSIPQILKVLRPNGPKTVLITGEDSENLNVGPNSFDTRIPVQPGDRLAIFGPGPQGTVACGVPGEVAFIGGFFGGGGTTGSTALVIEEPAEARIPVAGIVEPDADGDGFGDESQDQCPQLVAFQAPCPVVTLDASVKARKGSVSVLVAASSQAPVTVAGTVKLGKGKTARLNGGTQVVAPGTIARFTLFFPKALKDKLKELSTTRSLGLNIAATATDLIGRVSSDSVKAKLKGQKKPPRKKGKGKPKAKG